MSSPVTAVSPQPVEPPQKYGQTLGIAAVVAALASVLLTLWRGDGLWNASDGQYLLSGLLLGEGRDLYGDIAAAQPPLMYVVAAAAATIHDSWVTIRVTFVGLQVLTAVLVSALALRLGAPRWVAILGAVWSLLTPWALHEHGSVLPEMVATPLLLAAILASGRANLWGPRLAGIFIALAIGSKLPMILPALAILALTANRRQVAAAFAITIVAQIVIWSAWFGPGDLWRGTVEAQFQIGSKSTKDSFAYLAQAGWSLLPLLLLAEIGRRALNSSRPGQPTARVLLGAIVAGLLTAISLFKLGTLPVIVIPVEALLLPFSLAAVGDLATRVKARTREAPIDRHRLNGPTVVLACGLAALAAGALLVSPGAPRGFTWPGGGTNWSRVASSGQIDALRRIAEKCPRGTAWPGGAWVAVLANRRVPGDQADPFILQAAAYGPQAQRARADHICAP